MNTVFERPSKWQHSLQTTLTCYYISSLLQHLHSASYPLHSLLWLLWTTIYKRLQREVMPMNHERIRFISELVSKLWLIKLALLFRNISQWRSSVRKPHARPTYNHFRSHHPTCGLRTTGRGRSSPKWKVGSRYILRILLCWIVYI